MQKRYWADFNRTIQWFFQQSGTEAVILTNPNLAGRYLRYRDQEPLDCLKKFHSAQIRIDKRAEAPEKAEHLIGQAPWSSRMQLSRVPRMEDTTERLIFNRCLYNFVRHEPIHFTPVRPRHTGVTPWRTICELSPSSSSVLPQKAPAAPTWLGYGGPPGSVVPSARPAAVGLPHDAF